MEDMNNNINNGQNISNNETECQTIWMGDIQVNWNEAYICSLFTSQINNNNTNDTMNPFVPVSVKLIRDRVSGCPAGYAFIEFASHEAAEAVLNRFNGKLIPHTIYRFRLNWGAGGKRVDEDEEYSVFVGDLASDVTDELLLATFEARYKSVRGAKVVIDVMTRLPKGFGFVRFGNKQEADNAIKVMNGAFISSRPIRVSEATERSKIGHGEDRHSFSSSGNNSTIFVGGLDGTIAEEDLRHYFSPYGDIINIKIPANRACGFVTYNNRACAENAINSMNNNNIKNVRVRCAWGRGTANSSSITNNNLHHYQQQRLFNPNQSQQQQPRLPSSYPFNFNGGYYAGMNMNIASGSNVNNNGANRAAAAAAAAAAYGMYGYSAAQLGYGNTGTQHLAYYHNTRNNNINLSNISQPQQHPRFHDINNKTEFHSRYTGIYPPQSKRNNNIMNPTHSYTSDYEQEKKKIETKLTKWEQKIGDFVKDGSKLCEFHTNEANFEMEIADDEEGYLTEIKYKDGTKNIPPGSVIAIIKKEKK